MCESNRLKIGSIHALGDSILRIYCIAMLGISGKFERKYTK